MNEVLFKWVTFAVVISLIDVPGHTKVTNFDSQILSYHAVASSKVSVHKLFSCKICHTICNLYGHLQDTLECKIYI
jgi:hypothetical protein